MKTTRLSAAVTVLSIAMVSCSSPAPTGNAEFRWTPSEVVDFGALVTEDLPELTWGKAFLKQMGFSTQNAFDVRRWSVPLEGGSVSGSNAYRPPQTDTALPEVMALNQEAAEFLATLPVRAVGTDAFSIDALTDLKMPSAHHSFLSRGIPVYEQLVNVERVLGKERMFFVGVPLNIQGGDGMMVRPVVFVYCP